MSSVNRHTVQEPAPSPHLLQHISPFSLGQLAAHNIQNEVNSCYFGSGISSLGYNMLTSSNRIAYHPFYTDPLLPAEPFWLPASPIINCIPYPALRRKNSLRNRRRHSELPQVPAFLHLVQRYQAVLSRRRGQDMA